jgi:hypothetical protein
MRVIGSILLTGGRGQSPRQVGGIDSRPLPFPDTPIAPAEGDRAGSIAPVTAWMARPARCAELARVERRLRAPGPPPRTTCLAPQPSGQGLVGVGDRCGERNVNVARMRPARIRARSACETGLFGSYSFLGRLKRIILDRAESGAMIPFFPLVGIPGPAAEDARGEVPVAAAGRASGQASGPTCGPGRGGVEMRATVGRSARLIAARSLPFIAATVKRFRVHVEIHCGPGASASLLSFAKYRLIAA